MRTKIKIGVGRYLFAKGLNKALYEVEILDISPSEKYIKTTEGWMRRDMMGKPVEKLGDRG